MSTTQTFEQSTTTQTRLRRLDQLGRADVAFAGGKGANLGELRSAGLPVPDGFVIGAPAYAAFCDADGLRGKIRGRLAGLDVEDSGALAAASTAVREIVMTTPMPDDVEREIRQFYAELMAHGASPVAVRSSATAEDTAEASFAGMNETFLHVLNVDALLGAVRRCWASLFGARTIYYRAKRGLPQEAMDIAVVVQCEVQSVRAGVMFTVDPASGARDRLVIEGAFGLGEAVVSGSVTPDRYVVDKATRRIIERNVARKSIAIDPDPAGGTHIRTLSDDEANAVVLDEDEIARAREARRPDRGPLRRSAGHRVGLRSRTESSGCCSRGR